MPEINSENRSDSPSMRAKKERPEDLVEIAARLGGTLRDTREDYVPSVELEPEVRSAEQWVEAFTNQSRGSSFWEYQYLKYRKTGIWSAIKSEAIRQASNQCEKCHSQNKPLEVYHVNWERLGGSEPPEDIEVLCIDCHGGTDDPVAPVLRQEHLSRVFAEKVDKYASTFSLRDGWGPGWEKRHTREEAENAFFMHRYEIWCSADNLPFDPNKIDSELYLWVCQEERDHPDKWPDDPWGYLKLG